MAGGGNNVARMSPRQRMINLMYIVLTAMLALNVSSDVLNGFAQVHESLARTNHSMTAKNQIQFEYLQAMYNTTPEKAEQQFQKGVDLHNRANTLYAQIDTIKMEIARQADGVKGDYHHLINQDDLEAAANVLLPPTSNKGAELKKKIDVFRDYVAAMVPDPTKRATIVELLSTTVTPTKGDDVTPSWEEKHFGNMPAIASITMLAKLQNDIRQAEAEGLSNLITSVNMTDEELEEVRRSVRDLTVNKLAAYVIPNSNMVMRGGKYSATIILAAMDSTKKPEIFVGGSRLASNLYEFTAGAVGTHEFSGYIQVPMPDGGYQKFPFSSSYTVVEPMATISPTMMNVIYAGIDNPISISVPGVPMSALNASMTNGSLTRNGDKWVARSTAIGSEATISVTATIDGRSTSVGSMTFRVRKLPDPSPYLIIGPDNHYKGTPKRISKGQLLNSSGLGAAIDDDILQISYRVVSFTTVFFDQMGNAMPETSNGASFSSRQIEKFKQLKPGKSFFISNVKATGPDGVTRDISPMEVGLN